MQQNTNIGRVITTILFLIALIVVSIISLIVFFKKPTEEEIDEYIKNEMKSQEAVWEGYYDL